MSDTPRSPADVPTTARSRYRPQQVTDPKSGWATFDLKANDFLRDKYGKVRVWKHIDKMQEKLWMEGLRQEMLMPLNPQARQGDPS